MNMVHYVIKKLPRDVCDAENENATLEEIRNTTLDDIDIDPGIEFEVGDMSWMDDTTVNVRLHYEGKFKNTSYVGGKHFIMMGLDVESFSYSVLIELVKDNLHFTEIIGIYANKGRKASPEKPLKRNENEKVTVRRKLALELYAGDVEDTGNKDVVQKLPPPPLSEYLKFKKVGCRRDSEDTCIDVAEKLPPPPPLCEYEKLKLDKMRANNEVYKSLRLPQIVSIFKDVVESSSKSKGKKGKETDFEEDDSYVPANGGDVESDNSSEDIESVKQKKMDAGPRTRSRANAAPGKSGTATERAATSAYRPQPIKPTSTKIFRQSSTDEPAPGSVAAYFALRDRQMNNDEAPINKNVIEFEME
ncbi:hypothetical protein AgCh_039726 [Apium graveolens]